MRGDITRMTTAAEKRKRRRWTGEQKRSLLQQWEASGLSAYKFARAQDVPAANLLKWRGSPSTSGGLRSRAVAFAPVQVANDSSKREADAVRRERAVLELILDGGTRLRVLDGADPRMVSELVLAVGRRV